MAVVDDMDIGAGRAGPSARQGQDAGAAEEEFEAVVVDVDAEPVPDEARGHGVEHAAQDEARGRGDVDAGLVAILGPAYRQVEEHRALGLDALGPVGVGAADDLGDEAAIAVEIGEVARSAQRRRLPPSHPD